MSSLLSDIIQIMTDALTKQIGINFLCTHCDKIPFSIQNLVIFCFSTHEFSRLKNAHLGKMRSWEKCELRKNAHIKKKCAVGKNAYLEKMRTWKKCVLGKNAHLGKMRT